MLYYILSVIFVDKIIKKNNYFFSFISHQEIIFFKIRYNSFLDKPGHLLMLQKGQKLGYRCCRRATFENFPNTIDKPKSNQFIFPQSIATGILNIDIQTLIQKEQLSIQRGKDEEIYKYYCGGSDNKYIATPSFRDFSWIKISLQIMALPHFKPQFC